MEKRESHSGFERYRVLLIEDQPEYRTIISKMLEGEMYEVRTATNGQEGLQLLYEFKPHVIVCDLVMPVMNGKEVLYRIKGNVHTRHIPVIMLTSSDSEENEVDLLNLGASDFVAKSSPHKVMLSRLRKVLSIPR